MFRFTSDQTGSDFCFCSHCCIFFFLLWQARRAEMTSRQTDSSVGNPLQEELEDKWVRSPSETFRVGPGKTHWDTPQFQLSTWGALTLKGHGFDLLVGHTKDCLASSPTGTWTTSWNPLVGLCSLTIGKTTRQPRRLLKFPLNYLEQDTDPHSIGSHTKTPEWLQRFQRPQPKPPGVFFTQMCSIMPRISELFPRRKKMWLIYMSFYRLTVTSHLL